MVINYRMIDAEHLYEEVDGKMGIKALSYNFFL